MIPCTRTAGVLALGFGLLAAAAGAQTYTVTDLGSLGILDTFAFAVSDSSQNKYQGNVRAVGRYENGENWAQ